MELEISGSDTVVAGCCNEELGQVESKVQLSQKHRILLLYMMRISQFCGKEGRAVKIPCCLRLTR